MVNGLDRVKWILKQLSQVQKSIDIFWLFAEVDMVNTVAAVDMAETDHYNSAVCSFFIM